MYYQIFKAMQIKATHIMRFLKLEKVIKVLRKAGCALVDRGHL